MSERFDWALWRMDWIVDRWLDDMERDRQRWSFRLLDFWGISQSAIRRRRLLAALKRQAALIASALVPALTAVARTAAKAAREFEDSLEVLKQVMEEKP